MSKDNVLTYLPSVAEYRFVAERLELARTMGGLSMADVAAKLDVSRQYVHQLEKGDRTPNDDLVKALAELLQVEPGFFYLSLPEARLADAVHFRKRKTATKKSLAQARAHGQLFDLLVCHLYKNVKLPEIRLPVIDMSEDFDAERAAEECRRHFDLPLNAPIDNLTRVLEHHGVVVGVLKSGGDKLDAFSWYGSCRPLVMRRSLDRSPVRVRFSLAHELGHLVFHSDVGDDADEDILEKQADAFASALLLPRIGFAREFPRTTWLNWTALRQMKLRWQVSLAAIVRRARDLGLLNAVQYRRACIHISKMGWRTCEPDEPAECEQPEIVSLSLRAIGAGTDRNREEIAARAIKVHPDALRQLLHAS